MSEAAIQIASLSSQTDILVAPQGFLIKRIGEFSIADLSRQLSSFFDSSMGRSFRQVLPILLEQGIAQLHDGQILINSDQTFDLYNEDYGLTQFLPALCPYWLDMDRTGTIGYPEFQFEYQFYSGHEKVSIRRIGAFIVHRSTIYVLPKHIYRILEVVDRFNMMTPEQRANKPEALRTLHAIQQAATAGVSFAQYLQQQQVVVANTIAVDVESDESGRITLLPILEGVPSARMRKEHLRSPEPQTVYEIRDNEQFLRVVPSPSVISALSVLNKYRRIGGREREEFLADPISAFSKYADLSVIDLALLEEKVSSLAPYLYRSKVRILRKDPNLELGVSKPSPPTLEITGVDGHGESVKVEISQQDDLEELSKEIDTAHAQQQRFVSINLPSAQAKIIVPLTAELKRDVDELVDSESTEHSDLNSDTEDGAPALEMSGLDSIIYEQPAALLSKIGSYPMELKSYQKHGVAWLQHCFKLAVSNFNRHGALLADDMGLGKTLQVLTFIAWVAEAKFAQAVCRGKPVLIVCPLILLSVWERELRKFFYAEGEIFSPYVVLHGKELQNYSSTGQDGSKQLDIERLQRKKVIITNYDTVTNYFHVFSRISWSVIVLDEAQEIKEPKTNAAQCMKHMSALFSLALTGTPVENSLSDLWSIMDFAEPGLLGTQRNFLREFAPEVVDDQRERAESLRSKLRFHTPDAFVVRRTKEGSLDGLPPKKEILRLSPLTGLQAKLHNEIASELTRSGSEPGSHLSALQRMMKIYQHPSLECESTVVNSAEYYLENSAKLEDLISVMYEIKRRREKAIIFTRYINMQLILQRVLEEEFGCFSIINGSSSSTATKPELRQRIIDQFEQMHGFNGIILSPEVASVGLTITGANNVIHYGRWWNPAKESQATDRVYRLGQTRPVNIYHLISTSMEFTTFDEKLHMLLSTKSRLARDFLMPTKDLDIQQRELIQALLEGQSIGASSGAPIGSTTLMQLSPRNFEALAAALWRAEGFDTYLLPHSLCGSIKVVALDRNRIEFIACVPTLSLSVSDLLRGMDEARKYLEGKLSQRLRNRQVHKIIACNNTVSNAPVEQIRKFGTDLLDHSMLVSRLQTSSITVADLLREDSLRLKSIDELMQKLSN